MSKGDGTRSANTDLKRFIDCEAYRVVGTGAADFLDCIVQREQDCEWQDIFAYIRQHGDFGRTFHPFQKNGRNFALYAPQVNVIRLLDLDAGIDLGGETPCPDNLCPFEFFVPKQREVKYGFVSGVSWGDTTLKVHLLELHQVEGGWLKRVDRFPNAQLSPHLRLADVVELDDEGKGSLNVVKPFDLTVDSTNELVWEVSRTLNGIPVLTKKAVLHRILARYESQLPAPPG